MIRDLKPVMIGLGLVVLLGLSPAIKGRSGMAWTATQALAAQSKGSSLPIYPAFTLGYDHLLADYYWLAFISYVGDFKARVADKYALADRYLDIVTRLDPHFLQAYWFCAFSVGADEGKPEVAQKIIDRGIGANPNDWSLPFIGGFNQYLFAGNEREAARYYRMAERFPQAPSWLADQAKLLERGVPRIYKQIGVWEKIYKSQESPLVREKARDTLTGLWLSLYKNAPDRETKSKAAQALRHLGQIP